MRNTILVLLALAIVACAPVSQSNETNSTNVSTELIPPTLGDANSEQLEDIPLEVENEDVPAEQEDFAARLTYTEGDLIQLNTQAVDPDTGDAVELEFSKPFDNNGVWNTEVGDAGDYPVTVTARDSKGAVTTQRILVSVEFANRAPVLNGPESVTVKEGEPVTLEFSATDADEDEVIISYSGWMKSSSYTTSFDDAGEHSVTVTAEDGQTVTTKTVTVNVENVNRAPVVELDEESYEVTELETLRIRADAEDPDGDDVELSFSNPVDDNGVWDTQLDDAGEYTVTVTATDGELQGNAVAEVVVLAANRAPTITVPSEDSVLHVKEGQTINLRDMLVVEDKEGEEVSVRYSGWMNTATYTTTFEDAGKYKVTVTAEDESDHVTTQEVTIVVEDVNRPPVFVRPA